MAKVNNWPLNYNWAESTTNKLSFTQTEVAAGINYKGSIVSNQLNGVSYLLSRILQFSQAANGYYQATMVYHKGNFVSIVHSGLDHPMQVETYSCINDNNGEGISNKPPVEGATITDVNGVPHYSYGIVNSTYWKRIDVGASNTITPISLKDVSKMSENDTNNFCALLMSVPDINYDVEGTTPERTKQINASLRLTCKLGDKASTVSFRIKGNYLRKDDGTYIKPNDYFNMPVPDIYIDDVTLYNSDNSSYESASYVPSTIPQITNRANIQSSNSSPSKDQLMTGAVTPYGFNFVVGYTADVAGKRNWGIYVVSKESTEFELEGESTIAVTLTQISDVNLNVINVIPVRPNGGANSYGQLLELVEYDENSANFLNPLLFFSRGQVELRAAATISMTKFNCYKILARMQTLGSAQLKEHTARHTRAYGGDTWETDGSVYAGATAGVLLEPGLPTYLSSNGGTRFGNGDHWGDYMTKWEKYYDLSSIPAPSALRRDKSYSDVTAKSISIARYLKIF